MRVLVVGKRPITAFNLLADVDINVVAGRVGSEEGSMDYAVRDRGIEPVFIRHLQRDIQIRADFGAVYELLRLLRRLRPDVLHTHTAKAGAVG